MQLAESHPEPGEDSEAEYKCSCVLLTILWLVEVISDNRSQCFITERDEEVL